jgi:hypothetical protein
LRYTTVRIIGEIGVAQVSILPGGAGEKAEVADR